MVSYLLCLFLAAAAQDKPKDKATDKPTDKPAVEAPAKGTLPALWRKLGITDEQRARVYKVQADYRARKAALAKQLADLKKEERLKLEAILTDAQKARLKELRSGTTTPP
jgi:hypothetical protein